MPQDLAGLLRTARERAGLTRAQLAERVRVAPNHILRIENADPKPIDPRFSTVALIATELGLSLDDLSVALGYRESVKLKSADAASVASLRTDLRAFLATLEAAEKSVRDTIGSLDKKSGTVKQPAKRSTRRKG